jgi:hypothetical protein
MKTWFLITVFITSLACTYAQVAKSALDNVAVVAETLDRG